MANLRSISETHKVVVAYEGHGLNLVGRYEWLTKISKRNNVAVFRSIRFADTTNCQFS
jgi:hypothetical protein